MRKPIYTGHDLFDVVINIFDRLDETDQIAMARVLYEAYGHEQLDKASLQNTYSAVNVYRFKEYKNRKRRKAGNKK